MFKSVNGGILPKRFTKYSAGFDVFANEDVVIGAGETKLIGLGIAIDHNGTMIDRLFDALCKGKGNDVALTITEWSLNHYFELHIGSSLRVKGLTSLGTDIIDIDRPDEIKMVVHNPVTYKDIEYRNVGTPTPYIINKGDKIGQLILKRHEGYLLPEEYTLDNERVGGLGSTGQ